jgi:hypothetical protein
MDLGGFVLPLQGEKTGRFTEEEKNWVFHPYKISVSIETVFRPHL